MRIEHISSRQYTWLIITIVIATPTAILPGIIISNAKQNAWLSVMLATLICAGGLMLNLSLVKIFPRKTIVQIAHTLLGHWLGRLVGLFYAATCLYIVSVCTRVISQLIQTSLLPETPLLPLILTFCVVGLYGAWLGLECIARANDLLLPFSLLFGVIFLLLAIPEGELYRALPVLQLDVNDIITGAMSSIGCMSEIFFVSLIWPVVNKLEEIKSASLKGIMISGLILVIITQGTLFLLGVYRASVYYYPLMRVAEELHILDVFERLEPLIVTIWLLVNSIKICLFAYCFLVLTTQSLGLKRNLPVLLFGIIAIPLISLSPKNYAELFEIWMNSVAFKFVMPTAFFVIPTLLLFIAKVKKQ